MAKRDRERSGRFVSRGGDKLESALTHFEIEVKGSVAADLGANVGGFTDCLIQRGATRVYAVETGYGVLDWKLRPDERVVVMERENALHIELPEQVDLVVADVGWTSLLKIVPRALTLLNDGGSCLALLKPQYEVDASEREGGFVSEEVATQVAERIVSRLSGVADVVGTMQPEVDRGGRNPECFVLLRADVQV